MHAQPWPRLLVCWHRGQLRTALLHSDGRRSHAGDEAVSDAAQLAPALADVLAALHRPVRHAALVSDAPLAADALRMRLGLATLCAVSRERAQRLAPGWAAEACEAGDEAPCWAGAARALDLALHTLPGGAVCAQIRAAHAHLTRCERRVADVVLANPGAALETPIARLAEAAQVSQPQVIRFCRALGFDGLKVFKRALAESLATGGSDAPAGHPLLARSTQALRGLDRATLVRAAETVAHAGQIIVVADAARAPLRDMALQALWRAGLPARPLLPGDPPPVAPAVCLALGGAVLPRPDAAGVWITESAQATPALQLITGAEAELAPALLATLALQLLLADVAASRLQPQALRHAAGPEREPLPADLRPGGLAH